MFHVGWKSRAFKKISLNVVSPRAVSLLVQIAPSPATSSPFTVTLVTGLPSAHQAALPLKGLCFADMLWAPFISQPLLGLFLTVRFKQS